VLAVAWNRGGTIEVSIHGDGGWGRPESFADAAPGSAPALAVGADGTAAVAWSTDDGRVVARVRPPGSGWGEEGVLATGEAAEPRIAVDEGGGVVAAWSDGGEDGGRRVIEAASWDGSSWSPAESLSDPGASADHPDLAVSGPGDAVVVWRTVTASGAFVAASSMAASAWSEPEALSSPGAVAELPAVGAASDGRAVAAWLERAAGGRTRVVVASRSGGGDFGPGQAVSQPGSTRAPRVAVGAGGEAIVAWERDDEASGYPRIVAITGSGPPWSAPQTLSTYAPGAAAREPAVAVGATGSAVAVWGQEVAGEERILASDFWF